MRITVDSEKFRGAVPSVQGPSYRLVPRLGVRMVHRTAYCPATDRDVPVVLREDVLNRDPARLHASGAFVCLDFGVRCTGAMCPLRAVPRTSQDLHLHREGLLRLHRSAERTT